MRFAVLFIGLAVAAGARADGPDELRVDPNVQPAQFTEPPPAGVADPATPVVRVQVRVPAVAARGVPVKYTITVANVSAATAYRVKVRHPLPTGIAGAGKFDPAPDAPAPGAKEAVWLFEELKPGKSKVFTAEYAALPDAKSVKGTAFVSFEHGETVTTEIDRPRLAVRKSAPEKATAGEPVPVRVEVTNPGQVPARGVVLRETVPAGAEFAAADAEAGATPTEKVWKLGTLLPGQRAVVAYQLTSKGGTDLVTRSVVTADGVPDAEPKEATTKVQVAKLGLTLVGPKQVKAGDAGEYILTVANTGTLPLPTVRVGVAIPPGCTVTKMSGGGQKLRDELAWVVPTERGTVNPLLPGQKFELAFKLKSADAGDRVVRATADAGRSTEQSAEARTAFEASPNLQTQFDIAPGTLAVGGEGVITYTVKNTGSGPAEKVALAVQIPAGVSVVKVAPQSQKAAGEVLFDAVTVPAGGEARYTLNVRGEKPGQARFTFKLSGAGQPRSLESDKDIMVTAGGR